MKKNAAYLRGILISAFLSESVVLYSKHVGKAHREWEFIVAPDDATRRGMAANSWIHQTTFNPTIATDKRSTDPIDKLDLNDWDDRMSAYRAILDRDEHRAKFIKTVIKNDRTVVGSAVRQLAMGPAINWSMTDVYACFAIAKNDPRTIGEWLDSGSECFDARAYTRG